MKQIFQKYFNEIRNKYLTQDSTEGTLRTPFENFIKRFSPNINLIHEPKRVSGLGAPDFKAFYRSRKVGFIETKDLGKNLDNVLESEQLRKYTESINNLIVTDYARFILIRNGQKIFDFNLFTLHDLDNPRFSIPDDKIETFLQFINEFFNYKLPTISSAEELARELSRKAKLLKDLARKQLEEDLREMEHGNSPSSIYDFYEGIKELIKDISIEDCADAYAQTVTYGLFLARKNCKNKLERRNAAFYIPKNVGIIKKIFINISGDAFPSNISWIIDDIVDILNSSDVEEILTKIDKRGKKDKDPIIFFYEDFLNYYEPEKRKHLGVYYTPRPVVNFIVNSVNQILKNYFDKPMGFAEDDIHVLDPAIGTGTFFWIAFLRTLKELKEAGLSGLINEKIENHLLKHFYGFEILITPYVISHLKLTDLLQRWHYRFKEKDRIQVYLTNTLEPTEVHGLLPFLREITEESRIANQIKLKKPILVVMGNPPYSVSSSNKSKWIMEKMEDYKKELISEKHIGSLDDDYIKFIRFAQWKIEQNGEGIVGFITNNSYLDGIVHRQMRKCLLESFDRIYILNLHGSTRKKEKLPNSVPKDENVFDIKQGVAISIFIKNNKFKKEKKVFYVDLYGSREEKYRWLDKNRIESIEWHELEPKEPYYFFILKDFSLQEEYEKHWSITNIFRQYSSGVVTGKDETLVKFTMEEIEKVWKDIFDPQKNLQEIEKKYGLKNTTAWNVSKRRKKLLVEESFSKDKIMAYAYRPFDDRFIFYSNFLQRAQKRVLKHLLRENKALISSRRVNEKSFNHVLVCDKIGDKHVISDQSYFFPLYLYERGKVQPNFTEKFLGFIKTKYGASLMPEEILYYIYAILHSPTYRRKYEEFLRYDFPRIPFIDDYGVFKRLVSLGKKLVELHLMERRLPTKVKFDIVGSNVVEKVKYENGKVWINKNQYFEGVPEDIWNFYIGGYQVLSKWLKSRKNRKLTAEEIEKFLQIVEIIKQTIKIMEEIDKIKIV